MFTILRRLIFGTTDQTGNSTNEDQNQEAPSIKFRVNVEGVRGVSVVWGKNVELNILPPDQQTGDAIAEMLKDPRFNVPCPKKVAEPIQVLPREHTAQVLLGPNFPTMAKEKSTLAINAPDTQAMRKGKSFADQYSQMMRKQAHLNAGLACLPIAPDLTVMNFEEEEEDEGPKETEAPKPAAVGLKAFVDKDDKK
eukprot:TRINITY_DN121_c0_g1_i6.p1 TRINITY_DN121_c0_g1~~TRINITY_DN121_c0_g1_i6.p1  ORF type:complete len:195 (-),score=37.84 TRINITY_DN121_c0_g1_i6:91-675(-)